MYVGKPIIIHVHCTFNVNAVHDTGLIASVASGKASRTEKYLGACAAGKWVLHKSYLEECRQARR